MGMTATVPMTEEVADRGPCSGMVQGSNLRAVWEEDYRGEDLAEKGGRKGV